MPQDYTQAAALVSQGCRAGRLPTRSLASGHLYDKGQGVPQDYAQAALWYRKAAEQGYAVAQYNLGRLYDDGRGVPQDYAEAYFWLDLAAAGKLDGLELGTGCEVSRRSRVSPDASRSIPRTGAGAEVV